jgi:ribosome biogenesis GTP-binding protein YsxC/EngB
MDYAYANAEFVKSCNDVKLLPERRLQEVIFVGKSNVGKSSLINALLNRRNLAFTSSKPGHTRLLNYYLIENRFYFVDFPGYGYSSKKDVDYEFYGKMIEDYFKDNKYLKLIVFLLDSRHIPTDDDLDFYKFIKEYNYRYVIVMTKADKLNQSDRAQILKNLSAKLGPDSIKSVLMVSVKDSKSLVGLKNKIDSEIK